MKEANFILQQATENSLIIMDELGNGKFKFHSALCFLTETITTVMKNQIEKFITYFSIYFLFCQRDRERIYKLLLVILHHLSTDVIYVPLWRDFFF